MPVYTITYETDEGIRKKSVSGQPSATAAKTELIRQMLIERNGVGQDVGAGVGLHPMPKGMEFPTFADDVDQKTRDARLIEVAKEVWPHLTVEVRDPAKPFPQELAAELKKLHEESQPSVPRPVTTTRQRDVRTPTPPNQ